MRGVCLVSEVLCLMGKCACVACVGLCGECACGSGRVFVCGKSVWVRLWVSDGNRVCVCGGIVSVTGH